MGLTTDQIIQLCIAIPAVFGFLTIIFVGMRRFLKKVQKILNIMQQLMPNGGSTIFDRVVKLEKGVGKLEYSQKDQTKRLGRIEGNQREIYTHVMGRPPTAVVPSDLNNNDEGE